MVNWKWGELIGRGMFASVYLVQEVNGSRRFACKVAENAKERAVLAREAELQRKITHPVFAKYVDFVRERNRDMLFMEYIPGESLAELMKREGVLEQERAVRIVSELAQGLGFLHGQPGTVLYRDLKPDNIRIQPDGRARLLDLGCACTVAEARHSRAGSRGYAAPEQLESATVPYAIPQGVYSDVYALGRLLHYLLTGQNPCQPPFRKHPLRAYDPRLSPILEKLVEQCTAADASGRPPSMKEVSRRLAPFLKGRKKVSLRMREQFALLEWLFSGRRWEGEFVYEKSIIHI